MDLETLLSATEGKGLIGVLLLLVFGSVGVLSNETLSKKLSGLKWIPRARARWQREALEEDAAKESAAVDALTARIATMQRDAREEREWFQGRITDLRTQLDELDRSAVERERALQRDLSQALDYIRFVTSWARGVVLWADENGHRLPPPPWQSFSEWQKRT